MTQSGVARWTQHKHLVQEREFRNEGSHYSDPLYSLSFIILINKSHYTLMLSPTPPVSMSLDVSTKSRRVAPQARRRYLVIYIEIYGPK